MALRPVGWIAGLATVFSAVILQYHSNFPSAVETFRRPLPLLATRSRSPAPIDVTARSASQRFLHTRSPTTTNESKTGLSAAAEEILEVVVDVTESCDLIVSSLGDPTRSYPIEFTAQPVADFEIDSAIHRERALTNRDFAEHGCPQEPTPSNRHSVRNADSVTRRFFLHAGTTPLEDPSGYVPITAISVGDGKAVRIFLDQEVGIDEIADGLIAEIIRLFECEIIPRGTEWLDPVADVDRDGKLAILLTPWLNRLNGGRTSIKGCVRANDFQPHVEVPFGNCADVIYLNSQLLPGSGLKTVLAHEYTHAQCFSQKMTNLSDNSPLEDDWLNEGLAHAAEVLHGTDWSNLDNRVAEFLKAPEQSPLTVVDYYRAGLWRDDGCRGAVYLFLQFCVERYGTGLLRELAASRLTGRANFEQATGVPFSELFRQWTIALASDEFHSFSLTGSLGNRELTGMRRTEWYLEEGALRVALKGTTTSIFRLHSGGQRRWRITCQSTCGATLQITPLGTGE